MNSKDHRYEMETDLFMDADGDARRTGLQTQLHMHLRGRYHWALGLGLLIAGIGGLGGYFSQSKIYRSTSLIAISPVQQMILNRRGDDGIARFFDSWVSRQLAVMASPDVLDAAMASDLWQDTAEGPIKSSPEWFASGLMLSRKRGEEIIVIAYDAPKPQWAQAAVNAITQAYMTELRRSETQNDSQRLRVLENRRLTLEQKIQTLQARKRDLASEHNEKTIGGELERMSQARDGLKMELQRARLRLADMGVTSIDEGPAVEQFTPEQLARENPPLQALLQEKARLAREIEYKTKLGMGGRHRDMKAAIAAMDTLNAEIEKQTRTLRNAYDGAWSLNVDAGDVVSPITALRSREKELSELYDSARAETQHLSRIYNELQTLTDDSQRIGQYLTATLEQIDLTQVEGEAAGRAKVISQGGLSDKPFNTGKRKQLAALGGMAGFGAGFGVVLLLAMMDRRLRHFEDTQDGLGDARMLGVLPELPDILTDPAQIMLASHCVHQIRMLLQINRGPGSWILAITGPAAESGKTSLTMALGMSFANSGSKTLMIDCDIVGGGLTKRMIEAKNTSNSLPGVMEACNGTAFNDCVVKTASRNLWVLPIGSALPSQAGVLSPAAIKKLLAKARDIYDTVLIDTGPVLGSLEASMASAQADKTLVIVKRGDSKPLVTKSMDHLRSIGADIAGIVFNHAEAVDIERSTYASVTLSQNRRQDDEMLNEVQWIDPDMSSRYGPLATAVASYGQRPSNEDGENI